MKTTQKRPVYCHIVSCVNNKGTTQEKIFKLPKDPENRAKWIDAIKKSQQINIDTTVFNVCEKHFKDSDIFIRGSEKILKDSSIPTIFQNNIQHEVNNIETIETKETETEELKKKIAELEAEVFRMKIQSDISLQNEKIKAKCAVNAQKIQLKEVRKELSKKNSQIIKMSEVVEELKNNCLISDENAKFLNVSF